MGSIFGTKSAYHRDVDKNDFGKFSSGNSGIFLAASGWPEWTKIEARNLEFGLPDGAAILAMNEGKGK